MASGVDLDTEEKRRDTTQPGTEPWLCSPQPDPLPCASLCLVLIVICYIVLHERLTVTAVLVSSLADHVQLVPYNCFSRSVRAEFDPRLFTTCGLRLKMPEKRSRLRFYAHCFLYRGKKASGWVLRNATLHYS